MDMRRYLPIILLVFVALFILPTLLRGSGGKSLSAKSRGSLTLDAIDRIDKAEQKAFTADGNYTASLADLVATDETLASELTLPLDVTISVGAEGQAYVAQATGDILAVVVARSGTKLVTQSCREIKSTRGFDCPNGTDSPTTTTVTTTLPTTTQTVTTGTVTTKEAKKK